VSNYEIKKPSEPDFKKTVILEGLNPASKQSIKKIRAALKGLRPGVYSIATEEGHEELKVKLSETPMLDGDNEESNFKAAAGAAAKSSTYTIEVLTTAEAEALDQLSIENGNDVTVKSFLGDDLGAAVLGFPKELLRDEIRNKLKAGQNIATILGEWLSWWFCHK